MCEHEFYKVKDWRNKLYYELGEVLRIPSKCIKCGLVVDETFIRHGNTDVDTGKLI